MWVTPDNPPVLEYECRRVLLPRYLPMRDIVMGMLSDGMFLSRWQQGGTMTPDEAVSIIQTVFESVRQPCRMIGEVAAKFGDIPDGWLACDGSEYDASVYPQLAATLGPGFAVGAGRFVVPDLSFRTLVGSGGVLIPGDTGGSTQHTLTESEMPVHTHTYQQYTFGVDIESVGVPDPTGVGQPTVPQTTSSAGSGQPHNNMPPYMAVPMIIYSGVHSA